MPFTSGGVGTGLSTAEKAAFEANASSLTFVNSIRVGAEFSFKWRVILLFLIPSLITNLAYDPQRTGSGWVAWIPVAAAAYLASVLTFALAKVIKDRLFPKAGLVYALLWYLIIGFARGITAYWTSLDLGIATKNDFYFRLISPPIFSVTVLPLLAAIVTTVALQGEASTRLNRENLALRSAIAEFPQIHEQLRLELLERVRAIVKPAVDDIRSKLLEAKATFDSERLLNTLRLATDEIVRPLSQEVGTSQVNLELPTSRDEQVRGTRFLAQRIRGDLVVGWGTLLSVMVELAPEAVLRRILNAVVVAALLTISFYSTLWLANRLVRKIRANSLVVLALILSSYALAGLVAPIPWQSTRWHLHPDERVVFFLIALSVGLAVGLVEISLAARRSSLEALRETNDRMARLLSQLRRQAWIDRRRVATVLHGPIQGALQSASIRIAGSENVSTELIEQIERNIEQAMEQLTSYRTDEIYFEDVLDDVMAVWEDVVDFRLEFSSEALAALAQSSDASEAAVEVVREGITNAMKHSKPETIWISLTAETTSNVRVVIENDGAQTVSTSDPGESDPAPKKGYGSKLMSELAHSWSLKTTEGRAILTAQIVLEPDLSY